MNSKKRPLGVSQREIGLRWTSISIEVALERPNKSSGLDRIEFLNKVVRLVIFYPIDSSKYFMSWGLFCAFNELVDAAK